MDVSVKKELEKNLKALNKNFELFAKAGFTATKSEFVNAPLINELPMALECKVKSFKDGILIEVGTPV